MITNVDTSVTTPNFILTYLPLRRRIKDTGSHCKCATAPYAKWRACVSLWCFIHALGPGNVYLFDVWYSHYSSFGRTWASPTLVCSIVIFQDNILLLSAIHHSVNQGDTLLIWTLHTPTIPVRTEYQKNVWTLAASSNISLKDDAYRR